MIDLGYFWASRIYKISPLREKPLYYTFFIHEICFRYYREGLKMMSMGKNRLFRFFRNFLCILHGITVKNRQWSATMKMTSKNPEKKSAYFLHGWDTVRTFTSKSDEKVTLWITLIYIYARTYVRLRGFLLFLSYNGHYGDS